MVFKELARRVSEIKNRPLEEMSWSSLKNAAAERRVSNLMVSFDCKYGGGVIVPLDSDNIIDKHEEFIEKHLGHGDEMEVAVMGSKVDVVDGYVLGDRSKITQKFRLVE